MATAVLRPLTTQNLMVQNIPPTLLAKAPSVNVEHPVEHAELKRDLPTVAAPAVTTSSVQTPNGLSEKWEENDYIVNVLYDR